MKTDKIKIKLNLKYASQDVQIISW